MTPAATIRFALQVLAVLAACAISWCAVEYQHDHQRCGTYQCPCTDR